MKKNIILLTLLFIVTVLLVSLLIYRASKNDDYFGQPGRASQSLDL